MKKTFVFGILLAIASITAVYASDWKTVTLPFEQQTTDVHAILAYSDHFIVFGDREGWTMQYNSSVSEKVDYTSGLAPWENKFTVRAARLLSNGMSVLVGDSNLVAVSSDSGRVWTNKSFIIDGFPSYQVITEDSVSFSIASSSKTFYAVKKNNTSMKRKSVINDWQSDGLKVGSIYGRYGSYVFNTGSINPLFIVGYERYPMATNVSLPNAETIISAASNGNTAYVLVKDNQDYFIYETDGLSFYNKKTIPVAIGDYGFVSGGCISPKNVGYFIGINANNQVIKIGTNNSRETITSDFIPTAVSSIGDTIIIGGNNGRVLISSQLETSLRMTRKPESNIELIKRNGSFFIQDGNNASWQVLSLLGKVVKVGNGSEIKITEKGMYLIEIRMGNERITKKVIL